VRLIFALIVFVFLAFIYLNRTYANFYHNIGAHNYFNPSYVKKSLISPQNINQKIKYVALGDSLTSGIGVDSNEQTWLYLFSKNIAESKKAEVTLINLGQPSITSDQLIERFLSQAISEEPDLITIFIGINDIHNRVSPEQFEKNLDFILEKLQKETKAEIILLNLPYLGDKYSALPPYNFLLDIRTRQFNNSLKTISKRHSVILIDLYSKTSNQFKTDSSFYASDKFHPSKKGYLLLSQIIYANYSSKP
jgi:acyl-CoA thioesterase I